MRIDKRATLTLSLLTLASPAAGQFGPQRVITAEGHHPKSVFAADLDGDGDADVLSTSFWDDKVAWYENTGHPGAPFCFGDPGAGTPCPCNNDNDGSLHGSGCANGVFPAGSRLLANGTPSLGDDTLHLYCTGLEPYQNGLYFQADHDLSPGIVWGEGCGARAAA